MTRWLVALAFLARGVAFSQEAVSFESTEEEGGRVVSAVVPLGDGVAAAVAVVGADPAKARSGGADGEAVLELLIHDAISRLTLLRMAGGEAGSARVKRGTSEGLAPGAAVYLDPGQKDSPSRVVSWEDRYRDNVLPLALMRVHHPGDKPPLPGSPLFDDKGRLVAICHQEAGDFGNGTYALPVEVIGRVEVDYRERGSVVRCWIGIVMDVKHAVPSVTTVRPDSPAAAAGIETEDILLRIGRHKVRSYSEAVNAFYYLVSGETTEVEVLRGTERITLEVTPEVNPAVNLPAGDPGGEGADD